MSWSRDLPITWSRHVTTYMIYSHDLDTWPFRTPSQHQVIIDTNIRVIIPMSWLRPGHFVTSALYLHLPPYSSSGGVRRGFPWLLLMKTTGRLFPDQRLSRLQWWWRERGLPRLLLMKVTRSQWWWRERGFSSIAINESHWWEPRWVVSRMASWTQHKPDSRRRQHQLQPSTILLDE